MSNQVLTAIAIVGTVLFAVVMLQYDEGQMAGGIGRADAIVVDKSAHLMSLFRNGELLRSYRVALGRGGPGPKSREGDRRTPEGAYFVDGRNQHSCCYLALHISYPNAADIASAHARHVSPGGDIEIHGLTRRKAWLGPWHVARDWTSGCIAVTNAEMDEIWRAVPDGTPILIRE